MRSSMENFFKVDFTKYLCILFVISGSLLCWVMLLLVSVRVGWQGLLGDTELVVVVVVAMKL